MFFAFELTQANSSLIVGALGVISSIVCALIARRGGVKASKALAAVILGVEAGVDKVAAGGAPIDAVKETIRTIATDKGVQDYLHERVQALTADPPTTDAKKPQS